MFCSATRPGGSRTNLYATNLHENDLKKFVFIRGAESSAPPPVPVRMGFATCSEGSRKNLYATNYTNLHENDLKNSCLFVFIREIRGIDPSGRLLCAFNRGEGGEGDFFQCLPRNEQIPSLFNTQDKGP